MTQHTKGPWNVAKPNCGLGIFDTNGKSVAAISSTQKRPWAEKEANARLIAAAPELLDALLEASNIFDNYPEIAKEMVGTYEVVNKAIAKAKGV